MQAYLLAALVAVGACVGSYFYGRADGIALQRAQCLDAQRIATEAAEASAHIAAQAIAKIKPTHTVIKQRVEKEIHEKPIYRDCRHSDDVVRDIDRALTNAAEPSSGSKLPAADLATR